MPTVAVHAVGEPGIAPGSLPVAACQRPHKLVGKPCLSITWDSTPYSSKISRMRSSVGISGISRGITHGVDHDVLNIPSPVRACLT